MMLDFIKRLISRKHGETESITQDEYFSFLQTTERAIVDIINEIPDKSALIDKFGEESALWLRELQKLDVQSFRAGVCAGIFMYLKLTEDKDSKIPYVL